jgi:hypothetical protein
VAEGCASPSARHASSIAAADKGRPYKFVDADTLLADFFKEVYRELEKRKISSDVLKVTKRKD